MCNYISDKIILEVSQKLGNRLKVKDGFENLSEDAFRYDFFTTLMAHKKLMSSDFHIEFPLPNESFVHDNLNQNSKRKLKPKVDLYVKNKVAIEFAFFKGTNTTEQIFKLINDLIRLFLFKKFSEDNLCELYFIYIASSNFNGKQSLCFNKGLIPIEKIIVNKNNLENWLECKSAKNKIDSKFSEKCKQIKKFNIVAKRVFYEPVLLDGLSIVVYKVSI